MCIISAYILQARKTQSGWIGDWEHHTRKI